MPRHRAFLADVMLGKLSRWLRLVGERCAYALDEGVEDDDALARRAARTGEVLLTRDERLAQLAAGHARVFLLRSSDAFEQLREVAGAFRLSVSRAGEKRCPACGSRVKRIARAGVRGKVFPFVFKKHRAFWACENAACGKLYWRGSHWARIQAKLAGVKRSLARRPTREARARVRAWRGSGCVVDDRGRVLLLRRLNGEWDLPKGALRRGETPERGAKRELREETGLRATELERLGRARYRRDWEGRPSADVTYFVYRVRAWTGDATRVVARDADHDAAAWFSWRRIAGGKLPMTLSTRRALALALAGNEKEKRRKKGV